MAESELETCPRCGGTGVDPDPDAPSQWAAPASSGGGLTDALLTPLFDWILRKTLALFFPKFHARCRYCRGEGRVPKAGPPGETLLHSN
jgi:hypothetical protein